LRLKPATKRRKNSHKYCKSVTLRISHKLLHIFLKEHHSGVNFINFLQTAFKCTDPKSAKKTVKLSVFLRFPDLRVQKLLIECWWNWHLLHMVKDYIGPKWSHILFWLASCSQFYQHFTYKIFLRTLFWQLFSSLKYVEKAA